MEHESFEDPQVASVMNTHFINIKVDREERPDVDQVYMNAVQLMTGSGGWPLNVVALPDGRPVWGGTYFPKGNWLEALEQIARLYEKQPEKLEEYAEKLTRGIRSMNLLPDPDEESVISKELIKEAVQQWSTRFDNQKGGTRSAPKFMLPNNYHFLLRYAHQTKDEQLMEFVDHTLTKISYGGVYDHVGGGFSRYSTDVKWHVPHFEKMLYDNAQLVSLYADAYQLTKNPWYKTVVYETLEFVDKELTGPNGEFYSSLDADSKTPQGELEEGAYYVWTKEELQNILKQEYELFAEVYNVNSYGHWEDGHYVLIRKNSYEDISEKYTIAEKELILKIENWKNLLKKERAKRDKPRLDDKTLTSWNALMCKGYSDAYRVFGEASFLQKALKNADFLKKQQLKEDFSLYHSYKQNKSTINGYLEDYAFVIEVFIALYQNTFDAKWLTLAEKLLSYTLHHFKNESNPLLYFTSDQDPKLVSKTIEYNDNVIPASNSVMAKNLYLLSHYFAKSEFYEASKKMAEAIVPSIKNYPSGFSNWLDLLLTFTYPFYEIVIAGKELEQKIKKLNTHYIPNKLVAGASINSENQVLLKNRFNDEETFIYICENNVCKIPVKSIEKALLLIN